MQHAARLLQQGDTGEALRIAETAPEGAARSQIIIRALITRRDSADLDRALKEIRKWKSRDRFNPEPLQRAVEIHLFKGDRQKAEKALDEFRRAAPGNPTAHYLQAVLESLAGDSETAFEHCKTAIRTASSGSVKGPDLQVQAAMQLFEIAAGNYPGSPGRDDAGLLDRPAQFDLLRQSLHEWAAGIREANGTATAEHARDYANAWYNLGCTAMADFGRLEECLECYEEAVRLYPGHELAMLNRLFALNYSTDRDAAGIYHEHLLAGRRLSDRYRAASSGFGNTATVERPLRVAYLSSDFRSHSVAHFIIPVLEQHDANGFQVHVYHNHGKEDEYTRKAESCALKFRSVAALDDAGLMRLIRRDGIDILVDLNGLTENHRMALLAGRAAPLQLTWCGYPNTTGLEAVDYRIVDAVTDPPAYAQELNVETLLYLPRVFSVYQPPPGLPQVVAAPSLRSGSVTFGSFNALPKLNEGLLKAWAEILRRVPDARLLVKNIAMSYRHPREKLLAAFAGLGVAAERVELAGMTAEKTDHMKHYQSVDVCLDSFPYNGTTTTCDSLIMGVPVITRAGYDHRSRVGASQLAAIGLDDLVAGDEKEYIDCAVNLATDRASLQSHRDGLRERMQASPLMDAAGFTRELESAYRRIWKQWCEEQV